MTEQNPIHQPEDETCGATRPSFQVNRRRFLFGAGATVTLLTMPGWMRRLGMPAQVNAQIAEYSRKWIGKLSELKLGEAVAFNYPWDHPNATNFLIKLSQPAGGGVGPEDDVVAFNSFCTHQGGPLAGKFNGEVGMVGPCPLHWTTFDLTRHGMVVSGHATLGLPQIILETDGDDIYATGVLGLIFGYHNNRVDPTSLGG
ncbi:MAG: arsenate reductase (azurin) small subunit [Candidatus Bipolaricaulia bacterium]